MPPGAAEGIGRVVYRERSKGSVSFEAEAPGNKGRRPDDGEVRRQERNSGSLGFTGTDGKNKEVSD